MKKIFDNFFIFYFHFHLLFREKKSLLNIKLTIK